MRLEKAPSQNLRLDQLLCDRGLFASREKARRAVMAGVVLVDGRRVDKAGTPIKPEARIELVEDTEPFVSRAGRKLAHALDVFAVDPAGLVCLDVGASTGGFTDCLLQRGAARVYAFDVGYGQLDARLRLDPRVTVRERINARHLTSADLPEPVGLVTVDVSFISLLKVVPALLPLLAPGGILLTLVKPQFEAGRHQIGKGGIVRSEEIRRAVIDARVAELAALGLERRGLVDCETKGMEGNQEGFAHFVLPAAEGFAGAAP